METIRIFIGCEPKTIIPSKVLQYSILKHTKNPVEFVIGEGESWLHNKSKKLGVGTGFSLQRWTIPELFKYEGFAIYLDSDQLCLSNVSNLWNENIGKTISSIYCTYQSDKFFGNAPNTSVMLIDCEQAKKDWWTMPQIISALELDCPQRKAYIDIMHAKHIKTPPVKITDAWNRLNMLQDKQDNFLLHFTIEHQQPWFNPKHPYQYIWRQYLVEAIQEGFIQKTEVQEAIKMFSPPSRDKRANGIHPYWTKWVK